MRGKARNRPLGGLDEVRRLAVALGVLGVLGVLVVVGFGWGPAGAVEGAAQERRCSSGFVPDQVDRCCPDPVEPYNVYGDEWYREAIPSAEVRQGLRDWIAANCGDALPAGYRWLTCRDANDNLPDDFGVAAVENKPDNVWGWWYAAVGAESESSEGNGCELIIHPPQPPCGGPTAEEDVPGLLPDNCWGTYPTAQYQLSWKAGPTEPVAQLMGWMGSFMFAVGKLIIQIVLWVTHWGFSFEVDDFTSFSTELAERYRLHVTENADLRLDHLAFLVLFGWAAFKALRGRLGLVGGEIALTVVLSALATVLFANRADYLHSVSNVMTQSTGTLLIATQEERDECRLDLSGCDDDGTNPTHVDRRRDPGARYTAEDIQKLLDPLAQDIHRQFVEHPHTYLSWGAVIPEGPCLQAARQVLATGWDGEGWPSRHMERADDDTRDARQCTKFATYNRDMTDDRMLGALLTMAVALVVGLFLGLVGVTLVVAKFAAALLFALTPFVALSVILPGTGRRLAWWFATTVLQMIVLVVGSTVVLTLQMWSTKAVIEQTTGSSLVRSWSFMLAIVGVTVLVLRWLTASTQRWATRMSDSLTRMSPASANWAGGTGGLDVDGIVRTGSLAALAAGTATTRRAAALAGGVSAGTRDVVRNYLRDRRVKRFGARNLRDNRAALHGYAERPKRRYTRHGDVQVEARSEATRGSGQPATGRSGNRSVARRAIGAVKESLAIRRQRGWRVEETWEQPLPRTRREHRRWAQNHQDFLHGRRPPHYHRGRNAPNNAEVVRGGKRGVVTWKRWWRPSTRW